MFRKKGKKGAPKRNITVESAYKDMQNLTNEYKAPEVQVDVLENTDTNMSNVATKQTFQPVRTPKSLPTRLTNIKVPSDAVGILNVSKPVSPNAIRAITAEQKRKDISMGQKPFFSIMEAMEMKTSLLSENVDILSFGGVTQMTDLVLFTLMIHNKDGKYILSGPDLCKTKCDSVKELDLSGCFHLTDAGIQCIPELFPNLTTINLAGCGKVTETGLYPVVNKCLKLKNVNIRGTNVTILPYKVSSMDINTDSYPCISPEKEILKQHGTKLLDAPSYAKPTNEDLMKVCIIQGSDVKQSFIKYLKNNQERTLEPVETLTQHKVNDRFLVNCIQCHESICDMFITKRTVYIFPVCKNSDVKTTAARIFGIICQIINKVHNGVFMIVGMNGGSDKIPVDQIKHEVAAAAKSTATKLQKSLDAELAETFKKIANKSSSSENSSIDQQMNTMCQVMLSNSLENLYLDSVDINITKPFTGSDGAKQVVSSLEKLCTLYPEYQEMAAPIYKFALQDSVDKMLNTGVLSTESNKDNTRKMMDLMAMMGRTVTFSTIDDTSGVCLVDWFAKICNKAFNPPTTSTCNGRVNGVGDTVPMWDRSDLIAALQPTVSKEQASPGVSLLMLLGLSVYPSVFISFQDLPKQPVVSLDEFFPEIPGVDKRKDMFYTVGYKASLANPTASFILRQLLTYCTRLRKWNIAWQTGFIVQEGNVETLIEIKEEAGGGSCISLYCHTVKQHQGDLISQKLEETVWNSILQYKLVLDYVLQLNNIPHTMSLVMGKQLPEKSHVSALIQRHSYRQQENNPDSPLLCSQCGIQPKVDSLSWILKNNLCTDILSEESLIADAGVKCTGNMLKFADKGLTILRTSLIPSCQPSFKVHLLKGSTEKLRIGFGYGLVKREKQNIFLGRFFIDFKEKALIRQKTTDLKYVTEKSTPITDMPQLGDDVVITVRNKNSSNMMSAEINFYKNSELIASSELSNHSFLPFIEAVEKVEESPEILVYPQYIPKNTVSLPAGWQVGMKLEALDVKTPNLICVATVEQIDSSTGKLLIHFDGWGNNYDYWDMPNSPNFHPIGYWYANASKYPRMNNTLQKPRGYQPTIDPADTSFQWPRYFKETNSFPVPYDSFSSEQVGETTRELEEGVIDALSLGGSFGLTCGRMKNRARVLEFNTVMKCKNAEKLFEFFSSHSKFFCLLPSDFDAKKLQYPSLLSVMDFSKQNVHILCPGAKMELLHFLDDPGVLLTKFDAMLEGNNAAFLQKCLSGLLVQEETLPTKCSVLIPGMEHIQDKDRCEAWMIRLCFMYMCILELHANTDQTAVTMSREVMDVFTSTLKDKQVAHLFSEGDLFIRCKGHAGSSMANNNLLEFPVEQFDNVYMFMTRLDFQNNKIKSLPPDLFTKFKALEYLNLSKNNFTEVPKGIGNLTVLTEIDLSSNRLKTLPSDFENVSNSLTSLNISNNNMEGLPGCIFKLVKLEELYAENIGVVEGLEQLRNLMELKVLNLGLNLIEKIPEELGDLHLEYLDLSGVPWVPATTYQSVIAFMKQLQFNNVTMNIDLSEQAKMFKKADVDESSTLTPDEVQILTNDRLFPMYPRFGKGSFAFEKSGGIPPVLFNLKALKKLVLRYHGITMIPDEIKVFTNLNEIDLSYNPKMVTLSAELAALPLKQLHLKECTALNTPPKEIVSRGFLAVIGYLKRLRLGAVQCKRTKLMMVGLGGAGKTSLVQSLMSQRYRAYMDHDEPITDGIDIKTWNIPIQETSDQLMFSVWDFAGQTVYYNTHQFFLSNRAVYLLLWNVRQGYEHAGLDFWLSSIACHAPKAPILVVGTHIDKVEKFRLPEVNLKARYPQIVGFHYVSSYTGIGVDDLRQTIISNTLQQKYMGEKIPEAWLTLEKRLIAYHEEKRVDILPFKQLETISATCGIFDRGELIQAVQFLHDLGAVQFFDTDFLRDMIVIYPQWIVDVMACLVTVHQGAVKDGKMLLKDISKVWEDYPSELHPWLLRLTEEFDLTCSLPDEEASIVPCLLPDGEPEYDWPHADPRKNIRESMTVYKFQYLPAGLFNRAQVRLHQYSKGALLWKTGSFMKKNNHIALMIQNDEQEVIVRAQGFRPENFLFIVHEMIETLIRESYSGVHYDFFIPCMDCQSRNVKDPSMMSYQKVKRALELNVPFLQCEKFFHMLSLQEIKDAMPSDKMDEVDSHLRNSVRELIDLTTEKTVSVFFVYSTKDVPDLKDAEKCVHPGTILADMRSQDDLKVSYTDQPESSDMEALTLSIKANDVIVFGLSDNFANDDVCKKLLLYTKDVLQRPILLLLLGQTKNWQKGDLNMPLGDEVFVDMTKIDRYQHKIKELFVAIKKKDESKKKIKEEVPECFISYCWTNSHEAIAKGSRAKENALGWSGGDPRVVKKFLADKGIKCWIDVERVGGLGLYTSIADGLREAKVMVAFVSDEYAESKNCVMEFRQSLITLRVPTIIVVVGTGYEWERKEVGLMAVGHNCPKVNLQFDNEAGYLQILKLVQETMANNKEKNDDSQDLDKQRNIALQEVLELTQRKFLRHITNSFISIDMEAYPNLFIVDFITDKEKQDWEMLRKEDQTNSEDDKKKEDDAGTSAEQKQEKAENIRPPLKSKYCFRLMCEHVEGWHVMPNYTTFPDLDLEGEQQLIETSAPYLTRLYTIMKYSNIQLDCLTKPEGEILQQRLEEIGIKSGGDFKEEYLNLRTTVMQQDNARSMAGLYRCHVNGKVVWLCDKHKKAWRSKTEERYAVKFNTDNAIPTADIPESYAPIEAESKEQKAPVEQNKQKKLFRRNIGDQKPGGLKRQTSQACSVM